MTSNRIHVCMEQAEAPARDTEFPDGSRWVCSCGSHFVFRAGFNRAGRRGMDWWEAPPIEIPRQRSRSSLRDRLIRPGS